MEEKILKGTLYTFLIIYAVLFFTKRINLVTADLGRHIKNGKITSETQKPISTNFYSYTEPDYKTLNHHWASGVIFYKIHQIIGFKGLSLFYIFINVIPIILLFLIAKKESSVKIASIATILTIPLLTTRTEIRPEGFSYLFLGVLFFILYQLRNKKIKFQFALPIILLMQILWVNTHIFFIFGIFLMGIFWLQALINSRNTKYFKKLTIILTATIAASLINPYGIKTILEPFLIFREYGYMLVENQSIPFMQKRFPKFGYIYYELMFLIIPMFLLLHIKEKTIKKNLIYIIPLITFWILGFKMIRLIPLYGFFMIIALTQLGKKSISNEEIVNFAFITILFVALLGLFVPTFYFSPFNQLSGIGLMPDINNSAKFYKENNLSGPLFNNYDIGGYLIYHLYPEEKVFVDNRPEAYSVSFFKDIYIKMQEKEETWEKQDENYNFQTIFFYRHDATPWGQPFLIKRIRDPNWIPVYVDRFTIILVKNNERNAKIISKYKLPNEIFKITEK